MIKLVVSDMDGTLLRNDLSISKATLDAIEYIRNKNIKFTVATGRPDQLMKEYVEMLALEEPFIMYNGSVIGHPFKQERVYEKFLNSNDALSIIKHLEDKNIIYMIYTKDFIISKPHDRSNYFQKRNLSLREDLQSKIIDIKDITETITNYKVIKILAIEHNQDKFQKLKNILDINENLSVVMSQKGFLDINPSGTSKGIALSNLAKYYNYSPEEIIVFGDQENDVTMFQYAKTAIAMENANDNVKRHATSTTSSNEEDGFAKWIMKNL